MPFTAVLDVPWNADTKTIAINPLGKVPVWVMADGTALFDSRVIVEYARRMLRASVRDSVPVL